jgi:hypothetical protein
LVLSSARLQRGGGRRDRELAHSAYAFKRDASWSLFRHAHCPKLEPLLEHDNPLKSS